MWFEPLPAGRTYDLAMFQFRDPHSLGLAQQTFLEGSGGLGCTGPQKLAQQVIATLFTRPTAYQQEGSEFLDKILSNQIRTPLELQQEFHHARQDVLDHLVRFNPRRRQLPPDERLQDLILIDSQLAAGEIRMTLELRTAAGNSFRFIAPLKLHHG